MGATTANKKCTPRRCDCLRQVNEQLAVAQGRYAGAKIVETFAMDFTKNRVNVFPQLMVERIDGSKKKLRTVVCSHCPFCGKELPRV